MEVNTTILFYGIANTYYELGNFEKAASAINKSLLVSWILSYKLKFFQNDKKINFCFF